jgi:arsenate reductase
LLRVDRLLLARRLAAEALGTGLLVIAVVGSGIMAQRLTPGQTGLELLENSIATALALAAIILALGPVSGAHLNPAVSLVDRLLGRLTGLELGAYWIAQVLGGCIGAVLANLMFALPAITISAHVRSGPALWLGEAIATVGLILVIFGMARSGRGAAVPYAVGAYIGGAYWFTSSTSFANPAVALARTLTDTFAGIAPASAVVFIAVELVSALVALALVRFLYPSSVEEAP